MDHVAEAEEKAIAGVQLVDVQVLVGWQEGEGQVDRRGCADGDVGKMKLFEARICPVVGAVEEAGEGLGQLPAVGGVGDEVTPEYRATLEAMD